MLDLYKSLLCYLCDHFHLCKKDCFLEWHFLCSRRYKVPPTKETSQQKNVSLLTLSSQRTEVPKILM